MGGFFAKDWTGPAFVMFDTAHIIGLAIVVLFIFAVAFFGKRASPDGRRAIRYGLAAMLIVVEMSWHLWNLFTGQWTIQTMLPFHLCSALVWLSAYMLITKSYAIYEFAYLIGIAGALQALLTPDAGIYGFPHFRFFQVLASHCAIISAAVYMTIVEEFRPTVKSMIHVGVYGNIYLVCVFVLNLLIGSNYLFIAHKPPTASLLDVLPPWPWYIGIIELLGLAFVLLFYAPFAVKDWRKKAAMNKLPV